MRVNTHPGPDYGQVSPASKDNSSDPASADLAADRTPDASIPTGQSQKGLSLADVNPGTAWVRLQYFERHVHEIEQRQREGGALSDADHSALRTYDNLRSDPLFLGKNAGGEPTAMRRISDDHSRMEAPAPVPATKNEDGPSRQYIGGVQIKNDYTSENVADIFSDALKKPFASFARSAADSYTKLQAGRPISEEEKQNIDRYGAFVDGAYSMLPQGAAMKAAGSTVDMAKNASLGRPLTPEAMQDAMLSVTNVGDPTSGNASSGQLRQPDAPATNFNPPTRLPDGRVGYPLSPLRPPRFPEETPASKPSEPKPSLREGQPSGEPSGGAEPDPQRGIAGAAGAIPRRPFESPSGLPPRKGTGETLRDALFGPSKSSLRNGSVKKLKGKGPFNVEPPASPIEEARRIREFPVKFDFYRKDGEGGMSQGINTQKLRMADELAPHVRQDVLTVGNGSNVTSKSSHAKVSLGDHWGPTKKTLSKQVGVIELANGRNGVGAIRIPYENLKPGQSIVVTGGSLSGCTVMFASDTKNFYAYHAGTYGEGSGSWTTSRDGANAIRYASSKVKSDTSPNPHNFVGNNNDLIYVGNEYPFSVITYNGKYKAPVDGKFLNASDPQPLDARINVYQGEKNHGTHAFDYFISNQNVGQLGTAEAVISKDEQGVVTLRVLAEKGEIELPGPNSHRGGKYTSVKASEYEYKPGG